MYNPFFFLNKQNKNINSKKKIDYLQGNLLIDTNDKCNMYAITQISTLIHTRTVHVNNKSL